jgi:hypothetical protein
MAAADDDRVEHGRLGAVPFTARQENIIRVVQNEKTIS